MPLSLPSGHVADFVSTAQVIDGSAGSLTFKFAFGRSERPTSSVCKETFALPLDARRRDEGGTAFTVQDDLGWKQSIFADFAGAFTDLDKWERVKGSTSVGTSH